MSRVLAWRYGKVIMIEEDSPEEDSDGWPHHSKIRDPEELLAKLQREVSRIDERLNRDRPYGITLTDHARRSLMNDRDKFQRKAEMLEEAINKLEIQQIADEYRVGR